MRGIILSGTVSWLLGESQTRGRLANASKEIPVVQPCRWDRLATIPWRHKSVFQLANREEMPVRKIVGDLHVREGVLERQDVPA